MSHHTKWHVTGGICFPRRPDSLVSHPKAGADGAFVSIPPDMRVAIQAYNADLRRARVSYSAIPWVMNRILLNAANFPRSAGAPMGSFEAFLEWENKLWRDADVERLLRGPDAILPELGLFDVYRGYGDDDDARANLARFAVLYAEGGCYADTHVTLLSSPTKFLVQLPSDTRCVLFEKQNQTPSAVSSSFMLCAPRSEVVRRVLAAHAAGTAAGINVNVADAAAADATLVFVPESQSTSFIRDRQ